MASDRKPRRNPFYTLLMLASTLFVLTVMGYLVGPFVERQAIERPGAGPSPLSKALAEWFERKGVIALAVEFAAMVVFAFTAMATDRHYSPPKS